MLDARIELRGEDLYCSVGEGDPGSRKPCSDDMLGRWRDWARRYDGASMSNDAGTLSAIGREIFEQLNQGDQWLSQALGGAGTGDIVLDVVATSLDERDRALLDVPWELLTGSTGFLAADPVRLFRVTRRIGQAGTPLKPQYSDVGLVFMAADPIGQKTLNYDHEEAAILQATKGLPLHLVVEESGCLPFLEIRLAEGSVEALHLSSHGDVKESGPVLALETPEGRLAPTSVGELCAALGEKKLPLVVLSACRTAERDGKAAPFAIEIIRSGITNAIGWDGSVYDEDAILFASSFYHELSAGRSVPHAAAVARRSLLLASSEGSRAGRHWHLARVYLGPEGGGALCAPGKKRSAFRRDAGDKEFLDKAKKEVEVARADRFVGRRREVQAILGAFRDRSHAGVLIHGMGNLGKSSLAARIANRLPHHQTVVVYKRYDALAVFETLLQALPATLKASVERDWRPQIERDAGALEDALRAMLEGPFSYENPETGLRPILLVVDDLERILEEPKPGQAVTRVKPEHIAPLAAIVSAFRGADPTDSHLLLTSRYTFDLTDRLGDDLAARLFAVPLTPMDDLQRDKQMRAAARLTAPEPPASDEEAKGREALGERIKAAAGGNPGLQEILARPLLYGDADAAEKAVVAVEGFLASGEAPEEPSAATEFFARVSFEVYRKALTPTEAGQLRAATLFTVPVPLGIHEAAGRAAGIGDPRRALGRLLGLGLIDAYVDPLEATNAAVNPLSRPLVPALSETDQAHLAKAVIEPLYEAWKNDKDELPGDPRGLEAARLALIGDAPPAILNQAALAGARWLYLGQHDASAALELIEAVVEYLDGKSAKPAAGLLMIGADCAERVGKTQQQEEFLQRGLEAKDDASFDYASLLLRVADRLQRTGQLAEAEDRLSVAAGIFHRLGQDRDAAIANSQIADIHQARGELDEALRIRREEQLPVYERLGDVRSRAVTMGKIADILQARGELDEALRIRREEQLPVFGRLGDVRSRAVTMGQIADILQARGELDQALRIHVEERLPIAQKLGDIDSIAHIRFSCAQIRLLKGDLNAEAIKTVREELSESFAILRKLEIGRTGLAPSVRRSVKSWPRRG